MGGYVHRSAGYSGQKRVTDPWSCSYRGSWGTRYGCWCSEGTSGTLNRWAISQAPPFVLCMGKLKRSLSPWGCEGQVNDFGQNEQHGSESYLGQNICQLIGVISYLYLKTNRIIWKAELYFCLAQRVREQHGSKATSFTSEPETGWTRGHILCQWARTGHRHFGCLKALRFGVLVIAA